MQVRLGQTLFGAALGIVTAAGLAGAMATAKGAMEVRKRCFGSPAASTAVVSAKQYRTTRAKAQTAPAFALVSGKGTAYFYSSGLVNAAANAQGNLWAEFFASGSAEAYGRMPGQPVRLARVRPISAKGFANGEGTGYIFELMYPAPAKGVATGFGTTYHLAYGQAVGESLASGQVSWQAGAYGEAQAQASAEAAAEYTIAFYGEDAVVTSSLHWEPAVTIGGVRHVDAFGQATASIQAELTNWAYYPSVTAWASAYAGAKGQYTIGVNGEAVGSAHLAGSMIAANTSAGIVQSDSIAVASGRIRTFAKGYGSGKGIATGYGNALLTQTRAQGHGVASSTVVQATQAVVKNTKAYPDDGYGVAKGRARMNRVRTMAGHPVFAEATVAVKVTKIHIAYGVAVSSAQLKGTQYRTIKSTGNRSQAKSQLSAATQFNLFPYPLTSLAQISGQQQRNKFAKGIAEAFAFGEGANQVNDAVKAPVSRTLMVTGEDRVVLVQAETRIIVV